jgi:CRISPR-associated protein Cmr5
MAQTLEQRRAEHAWDKARKGVERHGRDYANEAKGLPALIMNSGLLQTMAYLESKQGGRQQALGSDLRDWLSRTRRTPTEFKECMEVLVRADPREFQAVTAEALAWLRWLRQMVSAVPVEPAAGD